MTITNPTLHLIFLGNDLEASHAAEQFATGHEIIRNSISFQQDLLSGLKSGSSRAALMLRKGTPCIEDIIATNGDIKAVLMDGTEPLFSGYLTTNYTWQITDTGDTAINVTLEDPGTRLFGKAFREKGRHLFDCSADTAIKEICKAAGIKVSKNCEPLLQKITATVEADKSCKDLLESILYELGCVYWFDRFGDLMIYKIDCTSTEGIPVLKSNNLYTVGGGAISLSKAIRQYRSARITFTRIGTATDYLVYRNTSGKDAGHPYCNQKLKPGEHFDGIEVYTPVAWEEAQADAFRDPALVEACNASSEIDIVGSNKIIAVSNVSQVFKATSGYLECSIKSAGGPYLQIDVANNGSLDYNITQMDAKADIIYIRDSNIVRTDDTELTEESSDNVISEELEFVHTRELAQQHANLLAQYHRFCNAKYTFFTAEDIAPGTIVKISDDLWTGLVVNVLITGRTVTDQSDIIRYDSVGISTFDLNADTWFQTIGKGQNDIIGPQGVGIRDVSTHFLASPEKEGVTHDTPGWDVQTEPTETNRYLWSYDEIIYTDDSHSATTPIITGVFGGKGEPGVAAVYVLTDFDSYAYPASSSGIIAPSEYTKMKCGIRVMQNGRNLALVDDPQQNGTWSLSLSDITGITHIVIDGNNVCSTLDSILIQDSGFIEYKAAIKDFNGISSVQTGRINLTKSRQGNQGEKGESYTTEIHTTNGSIFRSNDVDTVLSCHVFRNNQEITDSIPDESFRWIRKTQDPTGDERWSTSSKSIGKTVHITTDDCEGRTVFNCNVEI